MEPLHLHLNQPPNFFVLVDNFPRFITSYYFHHLLTEFVNANSPPNGKSRRLASSFNNLKVRQCEQSAQRKSRRLASSFNNLKG
ncbi:hypothetical protein L6452_44536 [Arctium lappa]|uniref:Uncharacterized protein n=1 Tax=Arctium lappa TaxID=4217 RepID=A0ACB8XG63_ARCLA|nr:hypothetical protein L6452_44536 [Arctium lappa]